MYDSDSSWQCSKYRNMYVSCTSHFIKTSTIEAAILNAIKAMTKKIIENEDEFAEQLQAAWESQNTNASSESKKELHSVQKRVDELDALIRSLYENSVLGKIPERQYQRLMAQYDEEQTVCEARIAELKKELDDVETTKVDLKRFVKLIRKYKDCETLTDEMLYELVEKVVIHSASGGRTIYTALMPYLPEDARRQLQTILNNAANITDDQKHFLQAIKNDVDCLYQKLCDLKSIGFRNLKDVAQIESTLRNKNIDLPNYANLNSDLMRSKTNVLNTTIDGVLDRIIQLRIKISRQNTLIQNIISRNQKEINDFLRYAGYHYTVSIEESEGKNYRLLLHYEDHREAINAVQTHLSYGERNALALLLFMYSIKRETPDLIILDDPISSFDGNKKFAIVNMLFKDPGHLKGKTVLLLTHEFGTVVDMVHTMKRNFGAVSTAAFLSTRNGVLQEQQIHAEDIKAYPAIAEKNIAESNDPLNKLIYLRRLMEFENNKNDAWQLLSNVFHVGDGTREVPMKCIGNGIEIPMTMDEIQKGTEDIKRYIPDFDYQMAYQRMEDRNLLISLYDSTEANYEKLQIYRLIFIERPMNVVVQKFVNETYHVENDYIFQLDPRIYDTVPQYIVDVCDQAINELRTVQPA